MGQGADGLVRQHPRMVEDFLGLYCGFAALMRRIPQVKEQ